jgi:hypothetical protein
MGSGRPTSLRSRPEETGTRRDVMVLTEEGNGLDQKSRSQGRPFSLPAIHFKAMREPRWQPRDRQALEGTRPRGRLSLIFRLSTSSGKWLRTALVLLDRRVLGNEFSSRAIRAARSWCWAAPSSSARAIRSRSPSRGISFQIRIFGWPVGGMSSPSIRSSSKSFGRRRFPDRRGEHFRLTVRSTVPPALRRGIPAIPANAQPFLHDVLAACLQCQVADSVRIGTGQNTFP